VRLDRTTARTGIEKQSCPERNWFAGPDSVGRFWPSMTGKFDPRAVLAKLRAGSDSPRRGRGGYSDSQASPGQPPSDPPPLGTSVQPRANHPQTLSRAQAPSDHQKNEVSCAIAIHTELPHRMNILSSPIIASPSQPPLTPLPTL